jgi:hypothetical protein
MKEAETQRREEFRRELEETESKDDSDTPLSGW